ncbi:hypothetical protein [Diatraea saccharalis granulovirus]|uniref:F-box domain-containing protein n=1 Tax=Diatraea saccharalis granulovirus TaxID=1675862 RepID=A0A0R7EYP2_9BBAC|nr:hypothetical protein [Diatraea saccharalis granulovirus]AKN80705.1 hypothetical protein [Diatraea saccharalis granulovirus]
MDKLPQELFDEITKYLTPAEMLILLCVYPQRDTRHLPEVFISNSPSFALYNMYSRKYVLVKLNLKYALKGFYRPQCLVTQTFHCWCESCECNTFLVNFARCLDSSDCFKHWKKMAHGHVYNLKNEHVFVKLNKVTCEHFTMTVNKTNCKVTKLRGLSEFNVRQFYGMVIEFLLYHRETSPKCMFMYIKR